MKLRNKKTGEITEANDWNIILEYSSLAELNEEWEDYEEPKVGYIIDPIDATCISMDNEGFEDDDIERAKELSLWFESREDAEYAIERLKAWKRVKEALIDYKLTYDFSEPENEYLIANVSFSTDIYEGVAKDLVLLFGGGDGQIRE